MTELKTETSYMCVVISVVGNNGLFIDLGCHQLVNDIQIFDYPAWIEGSW